MSSLLQGFRSGFDMMDRYFRNQESDRRFSEQMALQRQQAERAGQQHEASMQSHALNTQLLQEQVNDLPVQREHRDSVRALELDTARQQNEVSKFNLSSAKDRKRQSDAKERAKIHLASGNYVGLLTDKSIDNTNVALLRQVEGADSAIALSDSISNNNWASAIQHTNSLFKPMLNRNVGNMEGRNKSIIRDIEIADIEQQEDGTYKLPVIVTTDNGPYRSYISEMRGIDPDDPDRIFTADELLGTAAVMGNLAHILKSSGVYERLAQVGERALGVNTKPKVSAIPAEVQRMEYTRRLLGDEQYKQWLMYGRGKSPQELKMEAYKIASNALKDELFSTPEEKREALNEFANNLLLGFSQPVQSDNELGDDPLGIR